MKLIYTHQNPALAENMRNLLEEAGIQCILRNEYASGAVGELSFVDAWPEVWILQDSDYPRACNIIHQTQESSIDWVCPQCGEINDASFEICWQCGTNYPGKR